MQYLAQTYKYIYFLHLTIFVPGLKVETSIDRDYRRKSHRVGDEPRALPSAGGDIQLAVVGYTCLKFTGLSRLKSPA